MFTIGLPFRGRPLPRRPWKLVQTSLKVKKSDGRPFRAESSSFGAYSARKLFPFHVCTMDADGSGNKRPTEKSEQKRNSIQSVDCYRSICCPEILQEGYFLKVEWSGQAANCAPSRKINLFFSTTCQYPPLSGPMCFVTLSGFSPAICFPTALFGKSCCAWCVVFRKHSDDFLPTFYFFFSFVDVSLLLEFFI